jgi:hypothetical protein
MFRYLKSYIYIFLMASMDNEIHNSPEECPICNRVGQTLMTDSVLRQRLPETEIVSLVEKIQSVILNKEVKKTKRGINMADEKYVISKASFEDFYETQDTLVSIMEKMVDRIEKQDRVIMKFGAALADVMADEEAGIPQEEEVPFEEGEDLNEELVPEDEETMADEFGEEEETLGAAEEDLGNAEEDLGEVEEMVGEEEEAGIPVQGQAPMMRGSLDMEKSAFEAGYKAALVQIQKKDGVPVTPLEVPANAGARPVVPSANPTVIKTLDNLSDKELADMTPSQMNTWLRENKLYR